MQHVLHGLNVADGGTHAIDWRAGWHGCDLGCVVGGQRVLPAAAEVRQVEGPAS